MKTKWLLTGAAIFLAVDLAAAYGLSPVITGMLRRTARERAAAPIEFKNVHFHPLFLSFSAKNLEVFDPDIEHFRVLFAQRLTGRLDVSALIFQKKLYLASFQAENFELRMVKGSSGAFNVEKIFEMRVPGGERPDRFHGWKHQDWFFNAYERVKFVLRHHRRRIKPNETAFRIRDVHLKNGLLIMTDRQAKPVIFKRLELGLHGLQWSRAGAVDLDFISITGELKTNRPGHIGIWFNHKKDGIYVKTRFKNLDLALLRPLYGKTSPVFFTKGFLTLVSSITLKPNGLESTHQLKIQDHRMHSTVSWSAENDAVIRALNHHKNFEIKFTINGTPDKPALQGFDDALVEVLKDDFNKGALTLIRSRTIQEVSKFEGRLGA